MGVTPEVYRPRINRLMFQYQGEKKVEVEELEEIRVKMYLLWMVAGVLLVIEGVEVSLCFKADTMKTDESLVFVRHLGIESKDIKGLLGGHKK